MPTPTATPTPRPVTSSPNPAVPDLSTTPENTGPSGTSMPPPMRPVPSPIITARTTGSMKMKCQPSFSSRNAWPHVTPRSWPSGCEASRSRA